jgi:hypothetical protein
VVADAATNVRSQRSKLGWSGGLTRAANDKVTNRTVTKRGTGLAIESDMSLVRLPSDALGKRAGESGARRGEPNRP